MDGLAAYLIGLVYGFACGALVGWSLRGRRTMQRIKRLEDSIDVDLMAGNIDAAQRQIDRAKVMLEAIR